jgi:4,5-DOPA dioxygenase extradiol
MYPDANIPVLQLSIDYTKAPQWHYDLAKEFMHFEKKGYLIIGSGNMVHNLRMVAWDKLNEPEYGYDWALKMNEKFKHLISSGDYKPLINFESLGSSCKIGHSYTRTLFALAIYALD